MTIFLLLIVVGFILGYFLKTKILISITGLVVFYKLYFWIQLLSGAGYFDNYSDVVLAVSGIFTDYYTFLGFIDLFRNSLIFLTVMWAAWTLINVSDLNLRLRAIILKVLR